MEVGPAVAVPDVPDRGPSERPVGPEGERHPALLGDEDLPPEDLLDRGRVVPPADPQVRSREHEHPQLPSERRVEHLEAASHQQAREMRGGEDGLGESVPTVGPLRSYAIRQSVIGDPLGGRIQIPLLLVEERGPVGEEELEVSKLRLVDDGEVDLRDDPSPEGEPQA
jgi:hypothetical protein